MTTGNVIARFRNGDITQSDMLGEIEDMLVDEKTESDALLEIIEDDDANTELPRSLEIRMRARINGAPISKISQSNVDRSALSELEATYILGQDHGKRADAIGASSSAPEGQKAGGEEDREVAGGEEDREVAVGDTLSGRFELLEVLGEGGMSQVFKARDLDSYGNPIVAVKVLNRSFSDRPESLIALKRETAKSQELAHPNIVNVRDFGVDGRYAYMWMEFLEGSSLSQRLREEQDGKGLPREEALRYLKGMTAALQFAHNRRVIHADFKPGNVMLSVDPVDGRTHAKVIDFGIARPSRHPDSDETDHTIFDPGVFKALTPSYASPEMLEGGAPDARDDIYALACIVYKMFTGSHPYMKLSAIDARNRKLKLEPHPALNSREFKALEHAIAFDRSKRTPTASQFMEEFCEEDKRSPTVALAVLGLAIVATYSLVTSDLIDDIFKGSEAEIFRDCAYCPELVTISGGTFSQGSSAQSKDRLQNEGPLHSVSIRRPFAMGRHEVTVAEFEAFIEDNPTAGSEGCEVYNKGWSFSLDASWSNPGFKQGPNYPVTCVSWNQAQKYVIWLSAITGQIYRLPSASEWEYVASQPVHRGLLSRDEPIVCEQANLPDMTAAQAYPGWKTTGCRDGFVHTAPVGSLAENEAGTQDMLGNVFEWVADCWNGDYTFSPADGSAWLQGDCSVRELRGGSWFSRPEVVRASFRNRLAPDTRSSSIGFRVVRELDRDR